MCFSSVIVQCAFLVLLYHLSYIPKGSYETALQQKAHSIQVNHMRMKGLKR